MRLTCWFERIVGKRLVPNGTVRRMSLCNLQLRSDIMPLLEFGMRAIYSRRGCAQDYPNFRKRIENRYATLGVRPL